MRIIILKVNVIESSEAARSSQEKCNYFIFISIPQYTRLIITIPQYLHDTLAVFAPEPWYCAFTIFTHLTTPKQIAATAPLVNLAHSTSPQFHNLSDCSSCECILSSPALRLLQIYGTHCLG